MDLPTIWFLAIALLWTGYLVLEGFDFGVGMLLPAVGRDENGRRVMINSIGPVWDGNEVWLITAIGATFAAFPAWYAATLSGFYVPVLLIVVALVFRGVAFEYRGKIDSPAWRRRWDAAVVGGSVVPGAGAKLSDATTLGLEVGYQFTPAWSGSVLVGVPPQTKATATGTAAALGRLGKVRYGPLVLAGQYRFGHSGSVRPYIGAGAVYFWVIESKDGSLQDFDADSRWGGVLQAGIEVPLGQRYGLFLDVKKMFLDTSATATVPAFGGAPARAEVDLDPLVVHAGLMWRF
ncbi:MAG: cytochrome d ubiquinol oxidase subunit II [Pseudonocardia sp.]|nr:cytochrome d ubiquinol oxidase subunit II [Pseudonocardia sp.]